MTFSWTDVESFLKVHGRSLATMNPGSDEFALTVPDAMILLEELSGSPIPILGGDVVADEGGEFSYTYENWYCNRQPSEALTEFAARSHGVAKKAIKALSTRGGTERFIVFGF